MKKTKEIRVGNLILGGGAPVRVQSMLSVPAHDIQANVRQAKALYKAGCEILRVAVPEAESVRLIDEIKSAVPVPLVADIHFDYKIALECAAAGADKIRINPGNIGGMDKIRQVAAACGAKGIPIRVGVNAGSLEKELLRKYGGPAPGALVESALFNASLLEQAGFGDIVLSMKSSDVKTTFEAYRLVSERCDYPLHLGVTEAGTEHMGILKSAAVIGGLLLEGVGDTFRISLTADPVKEVEAGLDLLRAAGLRRDKPEVIACPTCGRTKIDVISLARQVENCLANRPGHIKVAVMGCAVNGPGEAKEADIGIAGGDGCGVIIKKGEILRKVPEERLVAELMREIEDM
ncbi:MAG TPA: 4-hydroxy-3-methylbut-2-en-1-yl diphosphate synthase [Ruminococcaceae bacterium]|nr:4-hydroxy-3-methylbut-2-en-1-yl diphosphate synthase [Oscillospiraceae bacterium]